MRTFAAALLIVSLAPSCSQPQAPLRQSDQRTPPRTLSLEQKTRAVFDAYASRGLFEEGGRAVDSLFRNSYRIYKYYGGYAMAHAGAGDWEGAARLMEETNDFAMESHNAKWIPNPGGGMTMYRVDESGRPSGKTVLRTKDDLSNYILTYLKVLSFSGIDAPPVPVERVDKHAPMLLNCDDMGDGISNCLAVP